MSALYWITGGNGLWASTGNWSSTSGGSSSGTIPSSTIDVIFDNNSGTGTSTIGATITIQSLTCLSGYTGTISFVSSDELICAGNFTLVTGMTLTAGIGRLLFDGSGGSYTITTAGLLMPIIYGFQNGTWTPQDNWTSTTSQGIYITGGGTFNVINTNITTSFLNYQGAGTVNLGSGIWTFVTNSSPISNSETDGGAIFNCNTSTVILAPSPGNNTGPVILVTDGVGNTTLITFYNLILNNPTSSTKTAGYYFNATVNVLNNFIIGNGNIGKLSLEITAQGVAGGGGLTVNNWTINTTSTTPITLKGDDPGNSDQWLLIGNNKTYTFSNLNITDSVASNGTFIATNSVDGGDNTGWTITSPITSHLIEGLRNSTITNIKFNNKFGKNSDHHFLHE